MDEIVKRLGVTKSQAKNFKKLLDKVEQFKPRRGKTVDLSKGAWVRGDKHVERALYAATGSAIVHSRSVTPDRAIVQQGDSNP